MKLAPLPLAIGPDDGFENTDLFGYKEFGERFANIVEALVSGTVLVLDGPWGSGKTTFAQQWAGLLRQRGHTVVLFDAYANDYQADAFIALAGAIHACSGTGKAEGGKILKETFLKSAASATKSLPSIATRVVINFVTQGAFSPAAVSKLAESIESVRSSQIEKRIANVDENTQAVNEFRQRLSALASDLAKGGTAGPQETQLTNETERKLVFIIDELDRCRPTFALEVLERIKHLFSVDEIVFVLVGHLPQLAKMVEKEYGVTRGEQYLEKFYHLLIRLPVQNARHQEQRRRYLEYLWKNMNVQIDRPLVLERITDGLSALAEVYELPLRTLERIAVNVALVCNATHEGYFRFAPFVSGLCVMRIVDPVAYEKARTGRLDTHDAMQFLRFDDWKAKHLESDLVDWHREGWIYATAPDGDLRGEKHSQMRDYGQLHLRFNVARLDMIRETCECIDDLWQRNAE